MKRNLNHFIQATIIMLIWVVAGFSNENPQGVSSGLSLATATYDLKFQEENVTGNSRFGKSVANAGDVNGDGFDDLIAGAYLHQENTGRAYIYFGGSGTDEVADLVLTGESDNSFFGFSVSGAGDVNDDGFADVIIGAYGYNSSEGRAYIYYGGTNMDNTVDVVLSVPTVDAYFGYAVSSAGDVNGDEYDDVIVGEPQIASQSGNAYIFFGSADMNSTADLTISGSESDELGSAVSGEIDVNNDGYDDVIVGSPGYSSSTGRADIYLGGLAMDNVSDVSIIGEELDDRFGSVLAGIGDMNNDNYSDIAVSSPHYDNGPLSEAGRMYIFLGAATMDNLPDASASGVNSADNFGSSLAGNADVNADGFDDLIVGAKGYDSNSGRAYLFYGGAVINGAADWFASESDPDSYFGAGAAIIQSFSGDGYGDIIIGSGNWNDYLGKVSCFFGSINPNNQVDLEIEGEKFGNRFAQTATGVGDINGDGISDVMFGAVAYNTSIGRAYLYTGNTAMSTDPELIFNGTSSDSLFGCSFAAGDFNDNWSRDLAIGAYGTNASRGRVYIYDGGVGLNTTYDLILNGQTAGEQFGISMVADDDLNEDGYADLVVGAPGYNNNTGRVYVFFGGETMNSVPNLTFNGEQAGDRFGISLAVTDANMDTHRDLIIGADGFNGSNGKVYLYHGGLSWDIIVDWTYEGTESQERVGNSLGTVLFDEDGFGDILIGAPGYASNQGRVYLFLGSSNISSTANYIFDGENPSDNFGCSVSGVGDVNDDNQEDFMVGANGYADFTGKAYVYFGGEEPNTFVDVTFMGEGVDGSFGICVAALEDINEDGISDMALGASTYQTSGIGYIFYGSDLIPPAPPVLMQAIAGDALVELTWLSNTESDFYKYYIFADTLENPTVLVDSTLANDRNDTTAVLSELINGKTYHIRLTAKDQFLNESAYSEPLQVTPYDPSGISETPEIPLEFSLGQNYPNPFNPTTTISYALPQQAKVQIVVYDILGTKVLEKNMDTQQQGFHKLQLDGTFLSSGIYFYRLKASGSIQYEATRRMVLIR